MHPLPGSTGPDVPPQAAICPIWAHAQIWWLPLPGRRSRSPRQHPAGTQLTYCLWTLVPPDIPPSWLHRPRRTTASRQLLHQCTWALGLRDVLVESPPWIPRLPIVDHTKNVWPSGRLIAPIGLLSPQESLAAAKAKKRVFKPGSNLTITASSSCSNNLNFD
jgi:hypothetical protein